MSAFTISWEEVVASTRVVATRSEALADVVVPGEPASGDEDPSTSKTKEKKTPVLRSFLWNGLKKFWLWHLPLAFRTFLAVETIRISSILLNSSVHQGRYHFLCHTIPRQIARDTATILFGTAHPSLSLRMALNFCGRFALATGGLITARIAQRVSWRTTEFGVYTSIKDDSRYQDEKLLHKAWDMATSNVQSASLLQDPTKCCDFEQGVGGGATVMQPCPGYCGIATLNSILRSFGGHMGEAAPYLTIPNHTRYVTLEEMMQLVKALVCNPVDGSTSLWEKGGGERIDESSIQVIGGGPHGLASVEQFRAALRQLSHPTQPARIMAIYHRSPLFFCSKEKSAMSKLGTYGAVHWSPVLAYLEEEDLVLVMDVNHMYGNKGYLVPTERFFDAVNTRDIFTGRFHGLILMRPPPCRSNTPSLLTSPKELSATFGKIKQAYYKHQAAGRRIRVEDMMASSDDGYSTLSANERGEKMVREVSTSDMNVSAVLSSHPVYFANEIYLEPGCVPSPQSVRAVVEAFSKLRAAPRVVTRGFESSSAIHKVHVMLTKAGLVRLPKAPSVMFLNLDPQSSWSKTEDTLDRVSQLGYTMKEITWKAAAYDEDPRSRTMRHSPAVEELAKLIVTSYKFPSITRRGLSPSDFYAQAYQTFNHGDERCGLRHFGCYEHESGELAACVALFRDSSTKPDVAAMFNVCTSPNHRRKGLGRSMTLYALEEARRMGCMQVLLEASEQGKPLYESLGFVSVMEEHAGIYISLSKSTSDFKWKNVFRVFELWLRVRDKLSKIL